MPEHFDGEQTADDESTTEGERSEHQCHRRILFDARQAEKSYADDGSSDEENIGAYHGRSTQEMCGV